MEYENGILSLEFSAAQPAKRPQLARQPVGPTWREAARASSTDERRCARAADSGGAGAGNRVRWPRHRAGDSASSSMPAAW
jgi:hypothetical protein